METAKGYRCLFSKKTEKENLSLDILNSAASDPEQRSLRAERHLQCTRQWLWIVYWLQLASAITKFTQRFVAVQSLSHVQLFGTRWTAAHQASLSFTISWSLLKLMFMESVMSSNHLILCRPLLLLPSIFPSVRVFSNASACLIRWPKF